MLEFEVANVGDILARSRYPCHSIRRLFLPWVLFSAAAEGLWLTGAGDLHLLHREGEHLVGVGMTGQYNVGTSRWATFGKTTEVAKQRAAR